MRLRILRIGFGDGFVLFKRGFGLPIVQKILRQPADGIEIVRILLDRLLISVDGFLVVLLLFVGVTERSEKF